MTSLQVPLTLLVHERIAPHAMGCAPAWLWSKSGELLWANAAAARALGAPTFKTLVERRSEAIRSAGQQIERIAPSLPYAGAPRLERLRGLDDGIGSAAVYSCARIKLAESMPAVLVVSAGRLTYAKLSLAERVKGLLAGTREPIAAYTSGGALLFCSQSAAERLGGRASLTAIQADALGAEALRLGRADADGPLGRMSIHRIGEGGDTVLLLRLAEGVPVGAPNFDVEAEGSSSPPDSTDAAAESHSRQRAVPLQPPATSPMRPGPERSQPLRFVWQTDAQGRFALASNEFAELVGGQTPGLIGRTWIEIASALELDPAARVERAIASHDTFTGISIAWPTADDGRVALGTPGR